MSDTTDVATLGDSKAARNRAALANDLWAKLGDAAKRARSALVTYFGVAFEFGRVLVDTKAELPRGAFDGWISEHCDFERSQAYRFIWCHQHRDQIEAGIADGQISSLRTAERMLAAPKPVEPDPEPEREPNGWDDDLEGVAPGDTPPASSPNGHKVDATLQDADAPVPPDDVRTQLPYRYARAAAMLDTALERMYHLITERYNGNKPVEIAAWLDWTQAAWPEVYRDAVVAAPPEVAPDLPTYPLGRQAKAHARQQQEAADNDALACVACGSPVADPVRTERGPMHAECAAQT